jgi:hypothetical protein
MGYHTTEIRKGVFGQSSKIEEEYEEWKDALGQDNPIMELVELSDMLGAVDEYVKKRFNMDIHQVLKMTAATQRAFKSGSRI